MVDQSVLTIGNFDGVHLGHCALIAQAHSLARSGANGKQLPVIAVTFDPHPATVLRPGKVPPRLTSIEQRAALLRQQGVDSVIVLEPTPELLSLTPRQFMEQMIQRCNPAVVVEGANFRFGHHREGDVHQLGELGRELGFEIQVVDPVETGLCDQLSVVVSSSLLRWLLNRGRVADAAHCLGRLYSLSAKVITGAGRGRTLDVPTANLDTPSLDGQLLPANGVYGGMVHLDDGTAYAAAISIGTKPTLEKGDHAPRVIEAHLLDFDDDLYDQQVEFRLSRWLRDQQSFAHVNLLRDQLARDIVQTRKWHNLGLLQWPEAKGQPILT
jgi:riboflavin kinase/FMN adenylyltransferase